MTTLLSEELYHHKSVDSSSSPGGGEQYSDQLEAGNNPFAAGLDSNTGPTKSYEDFDVSADECRSLLDEDPRLRYGFQNDEKFRDLWTYGRGIGIYSPSDLGYTSAHGGENRSLAETILLGKLLFWLQGEQKKSLRVMNQLNPPKWSERGRNYKNCIMDCALGLLSGEFDPNESSSGSGGVCRDTAVRVVSSGVLDGLMHAPVGRFKTADVTDTEKVDESDFHVRKILTALEDAGYIEYERDGREGFWTQDELLDIPAAGDEFYKQFRTRTEVNQQRHYWMENFVND